MGFDFEGTKPWETSTSTLLPVGNHVVKIDSATSSKTRKENNQIELQVSNDKGDLRDWVVYAEQNGVAKVVALYQAAGVELSNADQDDTGQLSQAAVDRLVGKKVGVVVIDEESYKDPSKTYRSIKGYVHPTVIEADAPADTTGLGSGNGFSAGSDDDIPF